MKTKIQGQMIAFLVILCCGTVYAQESQLPMETKDPDFRLAVPDKPAGVLADGFIFTEGPAADAKGNIFFTDIPNNRIHKWSIDGKLSTFKENSGGANGLFFDSKGNMIACA
ncbi:MAG: SMP-30/gluconolactonase/LRE family protein, partial [Sedimentisphaerales bacterium]|nr:SMP-30/gluconolactonase/LRE family protein [Sedimentisphaerales bacterium]